jgi:hypothetical protein
VLPTGKFHGIVLSDVLEHVSSPRDTLEFCRQHLHEAGLLLVNVPNFTAGLNPESVEVNPWEHLNYFTAGTLRSLVRRAGFEIVEIALDIGLRPNLKGMQKLGNALKSQVRLLERILRPNVTTCLLASPRG